MLDDIAFSATSDLSKQCASLLAKINVKLVCAESCTSGLIAAVLAQNPGISNYLCGSSVTYREATKTQWLGIQAEKIAKKNAVSPEVTAAMAENVLKNTDEAIYSLAITGHLELEASEGGPIAFVSIGKRQESGTKIVSTDHVSLVEPNRVCRQWEAARFALKKICSILQAELELNQEAQLALGNSIVK